MVIFLKFNEIKNMLPPSSFKYSFNPKKIGIYYIEVILDKIIEDCSYLFSYCNNILNIDLSSFDTKNVNDMSYMFFGCSRLQSIDLSSFDTKNVTNMRNLFAACISLKSIDLSFFNIKNVINMREMFIFCFSLYKINLPQFDTKNLPKMNGMFFACENLKNLDLSSSFDKKTISDMYTWNKYEEEISKENEDREGEFFFLLTEFLLSLTLMLNNSKS